MKVLGLGVLSLLAAMFVGVSPSGAGDQAAAVRTELPRVLCLNYPKERFYVSFRPARCDYYSAKAPVNPVAGIAIAPTKNVRWSHWGAQWAKGAGRYHVNGPGFIPARFRLSNPRTVCGRLMFTRLQVRIFVAGQGWKPWSSGGPLRSCP